MARDHGLEEILREDLEALSFAARDDGMLARLGKCRDSWAFEQPDIVPMISRGRRI